ncbi:WYL domain-containing protein [Protaetiibacter sp. SSC-01]|uniref:helix-turn-helix transcriptional regulator n=1 Tax=Protaetiibacter sp. SSC-01 TaxID=2759943 RepID=UPI0016569C10|nr:WYL domain-containing protein [Protaetiibacter sp. SSC-01]QNO37680.1 WYL domain-containing protein [Protaetiibacter sp. SSC-01]
MSTRTQRLLELLAMLQSGRAWSGPELAERLDVSERTVRADVGTLRELGYPVDAVRGRAGAYRLGAGARVPPLLLDDDDAVAVAVGLRAASAVPGVSETSARTLAKLETVLPARVRDRVSAIRSSVDEGPANTSSNVADPELDPAALAQVAAAVRDTEWLRFELGGAAHLVEPYRVVSWQRRWYLVARDAATGEWGTYRLDWMRLKQPTRRPFRPRPLSEERYTELVVRTVASSGWAVHARIEVLAPADEVLARINPAVGVVEALDAGRCVLVTGGDSYETIAVYIGMLGLDFRVTAPAELVDHVRMLGARYARAISR